MYERFTDRARKVMQLANQEARCLRHEYVGTEHILLGLVKEGAGVAAHVLNNLGINYQRLRLELGKVGQADLPGVDSGELPQTFRVKQIVKNSVEEARKIDDNFVNTEHLLLALLREHQGVAAEVLRGLGLKLEDVRATVEEILEVRKPVPAKSGDPAWNAKVEAVEQTVAALEGLEAAGLIAESGRDDQAVSLSLPSAEFVEYQRFTDRTRKVMQLANQEAQRLNHESVGTEHMLLGLVMEGQGIAANIMQHLDIDLRKARMEVEKVLPAGSCGATMGKLPPTSGAKQIIQYAIEEARRLKHHYVSTGHLLLGLLRTEELSAARVLTNLGLTRYRVRQRILELLDKLLGSSQSLSAGGESNSERDTQCAAEIVGVISRDLAKGPPSVPSPNPDAVAPALALLTERVRALERQLITVRFLLGGMFGASAGALLGDRLGAVVGLLAGAVITLFGRLVPALAAGCIAGGWIASRQFGDEAITVAGAVIGALLSACLVEVGRPRGRN